VSHGSSDGKAEPNLIPLLDLVFQLVMFFMMVCNFAMENVNEDVKLPTAQSARPADKSEVEVLYLNLNSDGKVMVSGRETPLSSMAEVKYYLKSMADEAKTTQERNGDKSGILKTVVIIRADKGADFAPVFDVLRECKQAGFNKWQLRAQITPKA